MTWIPAELWDAAVDPRLALLELEEGEDGVWSWPGAAPP